MTTKKPPAKSEQKFMMAHQPSTTAEYVEQGFTYSSSKSKTNAPRVSALEAQLAAAKLGLEKMTKTVCDSLFVDTLPEAFKIMDMHRNENHVKELRDERWELEFITKRIGEIEAEIARLA